MNQNEQTLSVNTSVSEPESPLTQQEDRKKAKKAFSRFALSIILPLLGANIVISVCFFLPKRLEIPINSRVSG